MFKILDWCSFRIAKRTPIQDFALQMSGAHFRITKSTPIEDFVFQMSKTRAMCLFRIAKGADSAG